MGNQSTQTQIETRTRFLSPEEPDTDTRHREWGWRLISQRFVDASPCASYGTDPHVSILYRHAASETAVALISRLGHPYEATTDDGRPVQVVPREQALALAQALAICMSDEGGFDSGRERIRQVGVA
jgi:hypothetical protein